MKKNNYIVPKKKINYNMLFEFIVIVLFIYTINIGYWYLVLGAVVLYAFWRVWQGREIIKTWLNMVDITIDRYKLTKELKKNGLSKNK